MNADVPAAESRMFKVVMLKLLNAWVITSVPLENYPTTPPRRDVNFRDLILRQVARQQQLGPTAHARSLLAPMSSGFEDSMAASQNSLASA